MSEGVRLYAGTHEGMFVYRSTGSAWAEVSRALPSAIPADRVLWAAPES